MSTTFADALATRPEHAFRPSAPRILIVDDEEMVRAFAALALEDEGYEIFQAGDAKEAAYIWSREGGNFDVLVADVSLPGQNGVELARNLRSLAPDLQVVFATGYEEDTIPGLNPTDTDTAFLSKPYSIKSLRDSIRQAVSKSAAASV